MQELATRCTDFNETCCWWRAGGSVNIRRYVRLGQYEAKLSDRWHKYRPAILHMPCANSLNMYQSPKYVFWVKIVKIKLINFSCPIRICWYVSLHTSECVSVLVLLKQSRYRPGVAQRVLRKFRFPDFVTTAQDGGRLSTLRTGRLYPQEILLVLISVRGWVDPRTKVRSEGFYVNEKSTDTTTP